MKSWMKLLSLVSVIVVAGCQLFPDGRSAPDCIKGTEVRTCTGRVCQVDVSQRTDGKTVVSPYKLVVTNSDVRILWKLAEPNKFKFKRADGPKNLKNETTPGRDEDFSDGAPTDDEDGSNAKDEGKNYRIRYANRLARQTYSYEIQYRKKDNDTAVFTCHPYISNQ